MMDLASKTHGDDSTYASNYQKLVGRSSATSRLEKVKIDRCKIMRASGNDKRRSMSDLEQISRTLVHAVVSAGSIAVEGSRKDGWWSV
jgi:hypothetical protein